MLFYLYPKKKKRNELFRSTICNKPSTILKELFTPKFEEAIIKFLIYFPTSKSSPKAFEKYGPSRFSKRVETVYFIQL